MIIGKNFIIKDDNVYYLERRDTHNKIYNCLMENPNINLRMISKLTGINRTNVSDALIQLLNEGWVIRSQNSLKLYRITEKLFRKSVEC